MRHRLECCEFQERAVRRYGSTICMTSDYPKPEESRFLHSGRIVGPTRRKGLRKNRACRVIYCCYELLVITQ
jgi:hypothetical protein